MTSSGNDQLKLHWAKANTNLAWPQHWDGSLFVQGVQMGGEVGTKTIPALAPGQEAIIEFEWNVPNPELFQGINANPWHFCLLGRIISDDDPMTVSETAVYGLRYSLENNNNVVLKNTTVVDEVPNGDDRSMIDNKNLKQGGVVAISNLREKANTFSLELIPDNTEKGKSIYQEVEVRIVLDDVLSNSWIRGGQKGIGYVSTNNKREKIVTGDNFKMENLTLKPNELGTVFVSFNFLTQETTEKEEFIYHLVQRDANTGEVIGGETFEVRKKERPRFYADAGNDIEVKRNQFVTLSAKRVGKDVIYNWCNTDKEHVHEGRIYSFHAKKSQEYKLEVVAKSDGYKDYDNVMVNFITPHAIHYLAPNPAQDQLSIKITNGEIHQVIIYDLYGRKVLKSRERKIDVSSLASGLYMIKIYSSHGVVTKKMIKS